MAPNSGWKGSLGWKSIGPFFTCTSTLDRNFPVEGFEFVIGLFGPVFRRLVAVYEKRAQITMPLWGARGVGEEVGPFRMGCGRSSAGPVVLRSWLL